MVRQNQLIASWCSRHLRCRSVPLYSRRRPWLPPLEQQERHFTVKDQPVVILQQHRQWPHRSEVLEKFRSRRE